jgi:hypothetical protein
MVCSTNSDGEICASVSYAICDLVADRRIVQRFFVEAASQKRVDVPLELEVVTKNVRAGCAHE